MKGSPHRSPPRTSCAWPLPLPTPSTVKTAHPALASFITLMKEPCKVAAAAATSGPAAGPATMLTTSPAIRCVLSGRDVVNGKYALNGKGVLSGQDVLTGKYAHVHPRLVGSVLCSGQANALCWRLRAMVTAQQCCGHARL